MDRVKDGEIESQPEKDDYLVLFSNCESMLLFVCGRKKSLSLLVHLFRLQYHIVIYIVLGRLVKSKSKIVIVND